MGQEYFFNIPVQKATNFIAAIYQFKDIFWGHGSLP
jgi:hypothetical protein